MIFDKILQEISEKHLVVEWLSWLPCKRDFINSTISETWNNIPNTLPSLKLLEQRVHELVGGSTEPSPPLDNIVGSKRLRSGRVNRRRVKNEIKWSSIGHGGTRPFSNM